MAIHTKALLKAKAGPGGETTFFLMPRPSTPPGVPRVQLAPQDLSCILQNVYFSTPVTFICWLVRDVCAQGRGLL